jgi:prepilin-type N-terminal cleavage/methylation domain-containing protein
MFKDRIVNEDGFTLIELLIVLGCIAILAALALPIFLNAMNGTKTTETQTDLINASLLYEQAKLDNNGLYPATLPNDILSNPNYETITFTRAADSLSFCAEADINGVRWFVDTASSTPFNTICTQSVLVK